MPRRSYAHYCALSRALDVAGERWTLLIVRELLAGPRRYTDLHADLPGVSTDVLAARLRELEQDNVITRRRLPPPSAASVYELTPRGEALLPALTALADWGAADLSPEPGPTDALRAHWFALPLIRSLTRLAPGAEGAVDVRYGDAVFHILLGVSGPRYGHGPAARPLARLTLSAGACLAIARDTAALPELIGKGEATVEGDGPLAAALRTP